VRVFVADERAGVADVEIAVMERHPERRGQGAGPSVGKRRRRRAGRRVGAKDWTVDFGIRNSRWSGCRRRWWRSTAAGSGTARGAGATTSWWGHLALRVDAARL